MASALMLATLSIAISPQNAPPGRGAFDPIIIAQDDFGGDDNGGSDADGGNDNGDSVPDRCDQTTTCDENGENCTCSAE